MSCYSSEKLLTEIDAGCVIQIGDAPRFGLGAVMEKFRTQGKRPLPRAYTVHTDTVSAVSTPAPSAADMIQHIPLPSRIVSVGWREPVGLLIVSPGTQTDDFARYLRDWGPQLLTGGIVALETPSAETARLLEQCISPSDYAPVNWDSSGCVVRKRVQANWPTTLPSAYVRRILLVCHKVVLAGGFKRFERIARSIAGLGCEMHCAVPRDSAPDCTTDLPLLPIDEALKETWDCVMVPGAGFPDDFIESLDALRRPNLGIRVQHILNDQSRRDRFRMVNKAFQPHIVVFNNAAWSPGDFTDFHAERFHTLPGAVDSVAFCPAPGFQAPKSNTEFIIGGLANKNPDPLVEAIQMLPERFRLRLYGNDRFDLAAKYAELHRQNRIVLEGTLTESQLPDFYQSVDAVVSTEEAAGWSNLCAEAMASGKPVLCTGAGTSYFAKHMETAYILEPEFAHSIVKGIHWLIADPDRSRRMVSAARSAISLYEWDGYSRQLLALVARDGHEHYSHAPDIGLHGKWPGDTRLQDLAPLLQKVNGSRIIDFGGAEGVIAKELVKHGAHQIRSFELDPIRVQFAKGLCCDCPEAEFRVANLADWTVLNDVHQDWLSDSYDIVLYLGIHHHLPRDTRMEVFRACLEMSRNYFAIRTPRRLFEEEGLEHEVLNAGFQVFAPAQPTEAQGAGIARIFKRLED